jgi:uncharacterized protein YodC (DUF2158 family)
VQRVTGGGESEHGRQEQQRRPGGPGLRNEAVGYSTGVWVSRSSHPAKTSGRRCSKNPAARMIASRGAAGGAYACLWLDAQHVKVRDRGRVVPKALVVAYAVHETGLRGR